MKIELSPTPKFETFRGVQFRVYEGATDNGIRLEMLGMFRIADAGQRMKFAEEVCKVEHGRSPQITPLIMTPAIVTDAPPAQADRIAKLEREAIYARNVVRELVANWDRGPRDAFAGYIDGARKFLEEKR